jgi:hypothetical protein
VFTRIIPIGHTESQNDTFNGSLALPEIVQCHYCDRPATVTVESDGVHVGLCDGCFHERLAELAEAEPLEDIEDAVNVESNE